MVECFPLLSVYLEIMVKVQKVQCNAGCHSTLLLTFDMNALVASLNCCSSPLEGNHEHIMACALTDGKGRFPASLTKANVTSIMCLLLLSAKDH